MKRLRFVVPLCLAVLLAACSQLVETPGGSGSGEIASQGFGVVEQTEGDASLCHLATAGRRSQLGQSFVATRTGEIVFPAHQPHRGAARERYAGGPTESDSTRP